MVQLTKCFCCKQNISGLACTLFGDLESHICTICRHMSLTFISTCGIPMNTDHPIINELVENTHLHGRGFWRYYNSITRDGEDVFRVVNKL